MAMAPAPRHPRDWSLSEHLRNDLRHAPNTMFLVGTSREAFTPWRLTGHWHAKRHWLFGLRPWVREVRMHTDWPPLDPASIVWMREYRWRRMTPRDVPVPVYGAESAPIGFGERHYG